MAEKRISISIWWHIAIDINCHIYAVQLVKIRPTDGQDIAINDNKIKYIWAT